MSTLVATGEPIPSAPEAEYHDVEHAEVVHEVVEHAHEAPTAAEITAAAGDFTVGDNLTVEDDVNVGDTSADPQGDDSNWKKLKVYGTVDGFDLGVRNNAYIERDLTCDGNVTAAIVNATTSVNAPTVECHDLTAVNMSVGNISSSGNISANYLQATGDIHTEDGTVTAHAVVASSHVNCNQFFNYDNLSFFGTGTEQVRTRVSNKYLPLDIANANASLEQTIQDTDTETIVTRSWENGVRLDNLQIRGRETGYAGLYPGLFFPNGTCSEELMFKENSGITFAREVGTFGGVTYTNDDNVISFYADPADASPKWVLNAKGKLAHSHEVIQTTRMPARSPPRATQQ